jgi:hypothetical protein
MIAEDGLCPYTSYDKRTVELINMRAGTEL